MAPTPFNSMSRATPTSVGGSSVLSKPAAIPVAIPQQSRRNVGASAPVTSVKTSGSYVPPPSIKAAPRVVPASPISVPRSVVPVSTGSLTPGTRIPAPITVASGSLSASLSGSLTVPPPASYAMSGSLTVPAPVKVVPGSSVPQVSGSYSAPPLLAPTGSYSGPPMMTKSASKKIISAPIGINPFGSYAPPVMATSGSYAPPPTKIASSGSYAPPAKVMMAPSGSYGPPKLVPAGSPPLFTPSGSYAPPMTVPTAIPASGSYGPPPLAEIPPPEAVEVQKEAYRQALDRQFHTGLAQIANEREAKREFLKQQNDQAKAAFALQVQSQLDAQHLALDSDLNCKLMGFQESAMLQRKNLEEKAACLTLDYQQKKASEELLQRQYLIQKHFVEAEQKIASEFSQKQSTLPGALRTPPPAVII